MMGVAEAFARLSCTRPSVFDSSKPLLIEGRPALGYFLGSQNAGMHSRNEHEYNQWNNYRPRRKGVPPDRPPNYSCGEQSQQQTKIPETNMNLLVTSDTAFAIFETPLVFIDCQQAENTSTCFENGRSMDTRPECAVQLRGFP
jgi:hypothetical protein